MRYPSFKISVLVFAIAISACSTDSHNEIEIEIENEARLERSAKTDELANVEKRAFELKAKQDFDVAQKRVRPMQEIMVSSQAVAHMGMPAPLYNQVLPPQLERQDRENYLQKDEKPIKQVSEAPVSTFSIDVDTAAYSNVRRMIMREGRLPPSDAVKAEEFINYFDYDYAQGDGLAEPFSIQTEVAPSPWNANTHLVQIGLKGFEPKLSERPASNLVFLVDVSGSMQSPYKLQLVKQSLRMLVNQLNAEDRIALVVYAGAAGVVLESTPGNQKAKILSALDNLRAGGSTNGGAGIKLAYSLARQEFIKGGINRVLIASDGDMNVGTVNHEALKDLIKAQRKSGIALSTLGFGSGNYNYALMEQLADVGDGNAAYIDSIKEAHKVLVMEMQSTLLTIAKDVKIQVEFNPEWVAEYRLIGYENRLLKREDFTNDKVDAGDIGAGHTVTALYEIALRNSGGEKIPARRYGSSDSSRVMNKGKELAFVKLRYKPSQGNTSLEMTKPILGKAIQGTFSKASNNLKFASAVAGFAQILQGGEHTGDWGFEEALTIARQSRGNDPHGYRAELVTLVELAHSLDQGQTAKNEIVSGQTYR